jgi:hypothetical protein
MRALFILVLLMYSVSLRSQNDAALHKGKILDVELPAFSYLKPCDNDSENNIIWMNTDSTIVGEKEIMLREWLHNNHNIAISIEVHSPITGNPELSLKKTQIAAECLRSQITHKVLSNRVVAFGRGEKFPLIPDSSLKKITDLTERKNKNNMNERVVITITSVNYKMFFSYTDKEFFVGQYFDPALSGLLSRNMEYLFIEKKKDPLAHPSDIEYTNEDRMRDSAFKALDLLSIMLISNPSVVIDVTIHTDTKGPAEKNTAAAQARGEGIRNYLLKKGVKATQVKIIPAGESAPLISEGEILKMKTEEQEAAHKRNRRVEIRISKV